MSVFKVLHIFELLQAPTSVAKKFESSTLRKFRSAKEGKRVIILYIYCCVL